MALTNFEIPEFLRGASARTIEQEMLDNLPDNIDKTEGGFVWDLTYPTALEISEVLQYRMALVLKMMFPMWAEGEWLDLHAAECGLSRREGNKAYGVVTVTGNAGLEIPEGFKFAVPSDNGIPAIIFSTLKSAVVRADGSADIEVQADEAGQTSNVAAETITIMVSPISGITRVSNKSAITGGSEIESDSSLRQRIDDYYANGEYSFVGCNADYERWAREVSGVGWAHTIPEYAGPNSVKIIVTDTNGIPANDQILAAVEKHIFGTSRKDINRLAPVGVIQHAVEPPGAVAIRYEVSIKLEANYALADVQKRFEESLTKYYLSNTQNGESSEIKYIHVHALLEETEGVADFKNLRMNNSVNNITVLEDEFPFTSEMRLTEYE